MYLLITVINNEDLLEDIITGWLDIGITGATVMDSTDFLQLISHHIPIFAGFRTMDGSRHNKTLFAAIEERGTLEQGVAYLEALCRDTGKPHQGVYFVAPLLAFGHLGRDLDSEQRQRHVEEKIGKALK